jgi:hypothetical protein
MIDPSELLDHVNDLDSFLAFVQSLVADWNDTKSREAENPSSPYGPAANGWENLTIGDFPAAAAAWAEDSRFGANQGLPTGPTWRAFAHFLLAGKAYE